MIDGRKLDASLYYKIRPMISIQCDNKLNRSENWKNNDSISQHFITIEPRYMSWEYVSGPRHAIIDKHNLKKVEFPKSPFKEHRRSFPMTNFVIRPNTGTHIIELQYGCDFTRSLCRVNGAIMGKSVNFGFGIVGNSTLWTLNKYTSLKDIPHYNKNVIRGYCCDSDTISTYGDRQTITRNSSDFIELQLKMNHINVPITLDTTYTQKNAGSMRCVINGKKFEGDTKNVFNLAGAAKF